MLFATHFTPYPAALREQLLGLHTSSGDELHRAAIISGDLARLYAQACHALMRKGAVDRASINAVGCHGQTVRHRPELGYTLQLNNPALLAELTGITVVADFRSRDVAAGGQGAPLVPAFHAARFRSAEANRVILNIGGIANVTALPRAADVPITGFDTGPGNMLLDAWAQRHLGRQRDEGGAWGAGGQVDQRLLAACLADAWFAQGPPKSTGRDQFHLQWLEQFGVSGLRPEDVQATLAELTAASIATAIARWCTGTTEVYACGGGVHNADLMKRLTRSLQMLPGGAVTLDTIEALGLHPDWIEAMAFAWLAKQAIEHLPGNLPAVTGAREPRVLGAIYPA